MTTSKSLFPLSIKLILSWCLFPAVLTAQNPSVKNQQPPAPSVKSQKKSEGKKWQAIPVTNTGVLKGCSSESPENLTPEQVKIDCNTDENSGQLINGKVEFTMCVNELPVCSSGLLSQHASTDDITAYCAKNNVCNLPLTCRYQQPPRCRTGQKSNCSQRCTP